MGSGGDKPADGPNDITDQPENVAPPLTPEQIQQLLQAQFNAIVGEVMGLLQAFAPHLSEADAMKHAQISAHEQMQQDKFPLILRGMIEADSVAKYPSLHLLVIDSKNNKIEMRTPKRFEHIKDLGVAAQASVMLAFLISPGARAVLRAFGFRYQLMQSQTPAGGRVILSS